MKDTKFFEQALELVAPWKVLEVNMDVTAKKIEVNPINLKDERAEEFERLIQSELKTSRAWMLKESFAGFWQQKGRWHAEGYFSKWYSRAIRSRLEPVKKAAKSLKNHLGGLLNYFIHPITNAVTEGLDRKSVV